jgi:hypothetical protein
MLASHGIDASIRAAHTRDDIWAGIARNYSTFQSPFVPCAEDIGVYEGSAAARATVLEQIGLRAIILGVTPGIALMRWPVRSSVVAIEASQAVIDALWPGDVPGARTALCADWHDVPFPRGSTDFIVGDGALNTCRFPEQMHTLLGRIADLLAIDGVFAVRCYTQPRRREGVHDLLMSLIGGCRMTLDRFKLRLYLAAQQDSSDGVAVRDLAVTLDRYGITLQTMRDEFGWDSRAIQPISCWRASDAIYSFPTVEEVCALFRGRFDQICIKYPSYELGDCCPLFILHRKS